MLRFIIFAVMTEKDLGSVGDVGVFLTDRMRSLVENGEDKITYIGEAFTKTFSLLNAELSEASFKKFNIEKTRFQGGFLLSQFEAVACGIGFNIATQRVPTSIQSKVANLWSDKNYTDWTGSGITAARRLPRLIPLGRQIFSS